MLKVVCVVDKKNSAIDRLAEGNKRYNTNLDFVICDVHPKRPDPEQLERFEREARTADIMDFQYFRTAQMLLERYEWLKDKPKLLAHHNPYSITESDWSDFDLIVANNQTIREKLGLITQKPIELIPNAQDMDFFAFRREFDPKKRVNMVANRIEAKKGILPVALACQELNIGMDLVGAISDPNYFDAVMATGVVTFYERIPDEKLRDLYYEAMIHVCNSEDNFESGTMPMLEAMMCGVPVVSRNIGQVPDIYTGDNLELNEADPEDVESLVAHIEKLMLDRAKMLEMRENAWRSIKDRNFERRAYSYQKLYRKLMSPHAPVTVIMPVCGRPDSYRQSINAVAEQDYPNLELIIVNDCEPDQALYDLAKTVNLPVRIIENNQGDYGLARARNKGIIEATGDILVFCDQRMVMERGAVSQFAAHLTKRTWLYGDKDGKTNFVENFSAVFREDIVRAGMFNERITEYGGMSQEIRSRVQEQGMEVKLLKTAKATPKGSSKNVYTKKGEIVRMKNLLWKVGL